MLCPVSPPSPPDATGLCRLSHLLLEDKRTQRVYRLERPLELYVTGNGEGNDDGAAQ